MESMWVNIQFQDFEDVMSKMLEGIKGEERIILRTLTSDFLNGVRLWDSKGRSMGRGVKEEIVHSIMLYKKCYTILYSLVY